MIDLLISYKIVNISYHFQKLEKQELFFSSQEIYISSSTRRSNNVLEVICFMALENEVLQIFRFGVASWRDF